MRPSRFLSCVLLLFLSLYSGEAVGQHTNYKDNLELDEFILDISTFQMNGQYISFQSNEKNEVEKGYDATLIYGDTDNPEQTGLGLSVLVKNVQKIRDSIEFDLQFRARDLFGWRTFRESDNMIVRVPSFTYSGCELRINCKLGEWQAYELNGNGENIAQVDSILNQLSSSGKALDVFDETIVIPTQKNSAVIFVRIREGELRGQTP